MRTRSFRRLVSGGTAVGVVALAVGCSSAGTGRPPARPAPSSGVAGSSASSPKSPASGSPKAVLPPGSIAAQRAAQAVQGAAAVPTAAQRAALKSQQREIARLSPAQLAGQRVIYSFSGLSAPPGLLKLIRHGEVGGVIFFNFNIASQQQLSGVVSAMVAANDSAQNPARRYPLLLMTDQEGGLVRRIPWAGPAQSEGQIGLSASPPAAATAAGQQAAAGLRAAGLNVNLAPVLDVFRQAGDFDDQFQRSYSMNPGVVSEAGAAFVAAQQAGGVAATVKHFPGLGAAGRAQDTDNGPVTIDLTKAVLENADEYPYRAAVKAGVRLAMVSWARYPALGSRLPAALSPVIVQGQLEDRVGFAGVTITDALGAGALGAFGSLQNRTLLAARAGMDALLCTATNPLPGWKCLNGLRTGYLEGVLPRVAFEAQLAQLLQLRASLPS